MHSVLTADLASLLSQHGPAIVRGQKGLDSHAVAHYWTVSKNRSELWHQSLARYKRAETSGDFHQLRNWWREHVILMEEVLVTEILTRVVAALCSAAEARSGTEEITPVTHAVHVSHLDARNRVLKIMLYGRGNSIEDAVRLNRLRQAVERWTDAMIGRMDIPASSNIPYAYSSTRASQYSDELRALGYGVQRDTAMWLMNASMHDTLSRRATNRSALPEANRAIAQSVLKMLRANLFDGIGSLKSIWLQRIEAGDHSTDRVVQPLDELSHRSAHPDESSDEMSPGNEAKYERWYL